MSDPNDLRDSNAISRKIKEAERLTRIEAAIEAIKVAVQGIDKKMGETEEDAEELEKQLRSIHNKIYFFSGGLAVLGTLGEWLWHRFTRGG